MEGLCGRQRKQIFIFVSSNFIFFSKEQLAADKKEEEGLIQRINKIEHNQINLDNQIKGLANKLDKILEKLG